MRHMSQLKKRIVGAIMVSDQYSTCPKTDLNKTVFNFLLKVAIDKVLDNWRRSDGSLIQTVETTKEKARWAVGHHWAHIRIGDGIIIRTFVDCELIVWVERRDLIKYVSWLCLGFGFKKWIILLIFISNKND